uniref:Uncharacterized protein n=1 Tax=Rhizophora mucronata TaxID=61149 RepID=A0A2P2PNR6_RHIMU
MSVLVVVTIAAPATIMGITAAPACILLPPFPFAGFPFDPPLCAPLEPPP